MYEKDSLRLIMPVRLFDSAACVADGVDGTPRHVCAESVCRQILLFKNFHGLQIRRIDIAYVFQNQGLGAIADHHPLAVSYQKRGHLWSPQIHANLKSGALCELSSVKPARPDFVVDVGLFSSCRRAGGAQ